MTEFQFIKTPKAAPQAAPSDQYGVMTTNYPCIKNGTMLAEGAGSKSFSNTMLIASIAAVPAYLTWKVGGGIFVFILFALVFFVPTLVMYWLFKSNMSPRINTKVEFPNKGVEHYLHFHDPLLAETYKGLNKIPMELFHELYFAGKVDFKGDCLDVMEMRHDWAKFSFTKGLFKFFLTGMMPEVIMHTRSQDEEQVRGHYDRGDDFYSWFLGPRMVYTSGIISDITKEESLEEMQDNKLRVIAEKIGVQPGDKCLDIGCGWGTLTNYLSTQYGAHVTGITLGRNQTQWGNDRLAESGISKEQSEILCRDYRDTPRPEGGYKCITTIEMSEHVGVRNFGSFLQQVYDMLSDDGVYLMQYAGLRKSWQYEDLIWGLFMNKYIFPGADASTPLGWTIDKLEGTGFEITSIDTIGVHYSGTLWHWYRNWMGNKDKVVNKYGIRWFRIWEFFLAYSTIISRQGSATCYQIVMRKNLNATDRAAYIPRQGGLLHTEPAKSHGWLDAATKGKADE